MSQLLRSVPRGAVQDQSRRGLRNEQQGAQRRPAALAFDGCDPRPGNGDEGLRDRDGLYPGIALTNFDRICSIEGQRPLGGDCWVG